MAKTPTKPKPNLTNNERAVIAAASCGEIADFSHCPVPPVLRAEILRRLITGLAQKGRKAADPVTPRGVRIKAAIIEGELDLSGWPGRADDPSRPLPTIEMENCTANAPIYLDESHVDSLSFFSCTLALLSAGSAHINGSVRVNGSKIAGADDRLSGAHHALDFAGAKIGGNVILRPHNGQRFEAHSELGFLGAQIDGAFNANGAFLNNAKGVALNFTRVDIRNSVFLTAEAGHRVEVIGEMRCWVSQIGGQFVANGALLQNPDGDALSFRGSTVKGNVFFVPSDNGTPFTAHGTISFTGARIEANLISRAIKMDGVFDVRGAHIYSLYDDALSGWPDQHGQTRLSGLTYDRLHNDTDDEKTNIVRDRLAWIKRQYKDPGQPLCAEFDPQPFLQYSQYLRTRGQVDDADNVLIEMREIRLAAKVDRWSMRQIQKFLDLTCRFGYSGTRAVMALIIWILIGTGMYGAHAFAGNFGPAEQVSMGQHQTIANAQVTAFGIWQTKTRGCPGLVAPLYAMDTILPVVEFGQRRACAFDPQKPHTAPLWRALDLFYALIGAVLFAITVVTLTGLLRED